MMTILEKLVYMQIKNKQLGQLPDSEYLNLYKGLTEKGKIEFGILYKELNQIFNRLNTDHEFFGGRKAIHSVKEYDMEIVSVSEIIMKMVNQFGLTLKREITPEILNAHKSILGKDSITRFLKRINQL